MLKKFKVLLVSAALAAGAVVLPTATATPAAAATPNASCAVIVALGLNHWRVPGQVSPNGQSCVPNPQIGAWLDAGVPCGLDTWLGDYYIASACN